MLRLHSRLVALGTIAFGSAALAAFAACVGDEPTIQTGNPSDSGPDTVSPGVDGSPGSDGSPQTDGALPDVVQDGSDPGVDAADGAIEDDGGCNPNAPFGFPENVTELNTAQHEYYARISPDNRTIYFARRNPNDDAGGAYGISGEIMVATRSVPSGPFGAPQVVPNVNDPTATDLSPTVTGDGLTMYLDSYRSTAGRGIYVAARGPGAPQFSASARFPDTAGAINGGGEDGTPYILPDNSALYFFSSRLNGLQIWRAARIDGGFDVPVEQPVINSATATDLGPVVTPDDLTIYFGSTRPRADGGTAGGYDIYMAKRTDKSLPWGTPTMVEELSAPNSSEEPTSITANGCTLYFHSQRNGGVLTDIWRARRGK
jgi:hypothetical protein